MWETCPVLMFTVFHLQTSIVNRSPFQTTQRIKWVVVGTVRTSVCFEKSHSVIEHEYIVADLLCGAPWKLWRSALLRWWMSSKFSFQLDSKGQFIAFVVLSSTPDPNDCFCCFVSTITYDKLDKRMRQKACWFFRFHQSPWNLHLNVTWVIR